MKFATVVALATIGSAAAFAGLSSFTARPKSLLASRKELKKPTSYRASLLMYEDAKDGPQQRAHQDSNVWTVLATTEKWISETLSSADTGSGNPYSRKEVNYICETSEDTPMIVANLFKRLREAREMGEAHGSSEENHLVDQGKSYRPHTLRQTQVVVIPSNRVISGSFSVFDSFIQAVNSARRNARDYVTDVSLEKLDDAIAGDADRDWSVSVNCAHLHPKFGSKTPEEVLKEMKEEDEDGEVDLHAQEYAQKRLLARQSPYPTLVVEVRSTPPPDFGDHPVPKPPQAVEEDAEEEDDDNDEEPQEYRYNRKEILSKEITSQDLQKLEAMFGKAAATSHPRSADSKKEHEKAVRKEAEDDFYDAIGKNMGIQEVSIITPMKLAQKWIQENDEKVSLDMSAFTESYAPEVDQAYEFVFTNLAMMREQALMDSKNGARRQYLVMPKFLSSSATSLEKFTKEVMSILNTLPDLRDKVKISNFHPEHVKEDRRSPSPILCLQWTEAGTP